jgi:hypothetical protein
MVLSAVSDGRFHAEEGGTDMAGEIGSVAVNSATISYKKVESSETMTAQESVTTQTASGDIKDKVTLNSPKEKEVTYSSPLTSQQMLDNKFLMLRELVANIFKSQGVVGPTGTTGTSSAVSSPATADATAANSTATTDTTAAAATTQGSTIIDVGDGKTADISTMTPDEAQKLVSEDGYWGVAQTADRIFKQAVGISGNDPTMIDKVKEGVLKGFGMARKAFGGELPDISQKTLDAVMKKLDDWTKNPDQSSAVAQSTVPV